MPQPLRSVCAAVPVALSLFCAAASAHIVLDPPRAPAGSLYRAALQVGHGCQGAATTGLTVIVPAAVVEVQPVAKAGWRIELERGSGDGAETIVRFSDGLLPDGQHDEFVITGRLPDQPGWLSWRVSQRCGARQLDWHDAPGSRLPAPRLNVAPADAGARDAR